MTGKAIYDTGERYQLEFLSGVEEGINDSGRADCQREIWKVLGTYEDRRLAFQEAESPEHGRARVRVIDRGPHPVDRGGDYEMTPEQIADQVLAEAGYADWYRPYQEQVRQDITAAIEADRLQRGDAEGQR